MIRWIPKQRILRPSRRNHMIYHIPTLPPARAQTAHTIGIPPEEIAPVLPPFRSIAPSPGRSPDIPLETPMLRTPARIDELGTSRMGTPFLRPSWHP